MRIWIDINAWYYTDKISIRKNVMVNKMDKSDIEKDIEAMETAEDVDLVMEAVQKKGVENLTLGETQAVLMDQVLSDRLREIIEGAKENRIKAEVYKEKTGDSEGIFGEKLQLAKAIIVINDEVQAALKEKGVIKIKVEEKDKMGRKPSKKLIKNMIGVFEVKNKTALDKIDVIAGLYDCGYSAEEITMAFYVSWCVRWGVLSIKNGLYEINKPVIKELYGF